MAQITNALDKATWRPGVRELDKLKSYINKEKKRREELEKLNAAYKQSMASAPAKA